MFLKPHNWVLYFLLLMQIEWGFSQTSCTGTLGIPIVNEDFGKGISNISLAQVNPNASTTLQAKNGDCPNDGWYNISSTTGSNCFGTWATSGDHTGGGRMMIINADITPSEFYKLSVDLCSNTTYEFAIWIQNICNNGILPEIEFIIYDATSNQLNAPGQTTGGIPFGKWERKSILFTTPPNTSKATLILKNIASGGGGNDLAIDDITFASCSPEIISSCGSATATALFGSGPYTYNWSPLGGTNITASGLAVGNYTVAISSANSSCNATQTVTITKTSPTISTTSELTSCKNAIGSATATVSGGFSGITYAWSTTPIQTTTTATGLASGTYSVSISDSLGCTASATVSVANPTIPIALFSVSPICLNVSKNFINNSVNALLSTWNFGDGQPNSLQTSPAHTYTTAGTHTITLMVVSQTGCKDSINKIITVYNPPIAAFTNPDSGCVPVCQKLMDVSQSVDGNITTWAWTLTSGTPPTATTSLVQACWNIPGTYEVELIVTTSNGCSDTLTKPNYIKAYSLPKADFTSTSKQVTINEPWFSFSNLCSSDVVKWVWSFGDGSLDSITKDPTHTYTLSASGNTNYKYEVCLRVENKGGCIDTICKTVELMPEFTFYMPNTITPNGDSINDFFFGKCRGVKEYNIMIFDRWGNLIWECNYKGDNSIWDKNNLDGMSSACKWNGTMNEISTNKPLQEDVYVWKAKLTDVFEKKHYYVGNVNVVR